MKIFGREYGLRYTVGAEEEIRKLCPGEDLKNLREVLSGIDGAAEMACIMSRWHEKAMAMEARMEGREYTEQPLTREVAELIDMEDFPALMNEVMTAMTQGKAKSVEIEDSPESKKKETPSAESS